MHSESPAIEAEALSKAYPVSDGWRDLLWWRRRRRRALRGVDFRLERGRVLGLVGANGAGKTTLIKILSTTLIPDSGSCRVFGRDAAAQTHAVKSRVGLVVNEERSFYFRLSVRENLRFFAALWDLRGADRDRRIAEVLDTVGLASRADDRFHRLSTGMRQRLAIARGLLVDADLLLLDEPTRSLDPVAARTIRQFVRQELVTERGKSAVLASNDLAEVRDLADDLLVLRRGAAIAHGPIETLRAKWGEGLDGLLDELAVPAGIEGDESDEVEA